jgi:hypothetical protein
MVEAPPASRTSCPPAVWYAASSPALHRDRLSRMMRQDHRRMERASAEEPVVELLSANTKGFVETLTRSGGVAVN